MNYINQIDDITDDDLNIIKSTLKSHEILRLNNYLKAM